MARRQVILGGHPPTFVDESTTSQAVLPGIFLDETAVVLVLTIAETADAVDAPFIDNLAFHLIVTETEHAAATTSQKIVFAPHVVETAHALDAPSVDNPVFDLFISTRRNAVDTTSATLVFSRSIIETLHATDTQTPGINLTIREIGTALDSYTEATNGTIRLAIVETLHAVETLTVQNIFYLNIVERTNSPVTLQTASVDGTINLSVVERGSGTVTRQSATIKARPVMHETGNAVDHITASLRAGIWNLFVQEFGFALDRNIDPETFASPGIFFWGYDYFLPNFPRLAVWCGGLDCGDHPINADGSVFVPWQSDPDGLFTPAYLIDVSNRLSGDIRNNFGATACNIDLTTNTGMIRITVDVAIGLPYKSRLQLLRPNSVDLTHSQYGPSLAETRRLHQYGAQLANAQGLSVGTTEANLRPMVFTNPRGDKYPASQLFAGVHWDLVDDDYDFNGMLLVEMFRPYPAAISALIGFSKTYDRD